MAVDDICINLNLKKIGTIMFRLYGTVLYWNFHRTPEVDSDICRFSNRM